MDTSMTTSAENNKIFNKIIFPIPISMMHVKSYVITRAAEAFIRQRSKGKFSINFNLRSFAKFFRSLTNKINSILSRQTLVFTFLTAISPVFSSRWLKIFNFTTIFASHRNFFTCIPFMKALKGTEKSKAILFNDKFFKTIFARCGFLRITNISRASARATYLIQARFKSFFARTTNFIHGDNIHHLLTIEQVNT